MRELDQWALAQSRADDIAAAIELSAGGDSSLLKELDAQLDALERTIAQLERDNLLSGEKDINSAFVTIHPGAGGTESQDWAQMLMRMYLRWAERSGYAVQVIDLTRMLGDRLGLAPLLWLRLLYLFSHAPSSRELSSR